MLRFVVWIANPERFGSRSRILLGLNGQKRISNQVRKNANLDWDG
jgi:hypothetical protein